MNRLSATLNSDVTFGASNVRHTLLRSHQLSDVHKAFRELVFDGESINCNTINKIYDCVNFSPPGIIFWWLSRIELKQKFLLKGKKLQSLLKTTKSSKDRSAEVNRFA